MSVNTTAKKEITADSDHTLNNVPDTSRKKWLPIFVVLLGFTFLSTTMAAGANLGIAFMLKDLIKILLVGSLILSMYTALISGISAKTGLNSVLLARYSLGTYGAKWADIVLGGTQVVWYAVQSAYMGDIFCRGLGLEEYFVPITIFWSIFMGAFALWGTKGMEIIGYLAVPPFLYLAYKLPALGISAAGGVGNLFLIEPLTTMTFSAAVTTVVGTFVSGGTNAPNWARFAKTPKQAFTASFLAFFIGTIVMVACGMIGGLAIQVGDMVEIMMNMGIIVMGVVILIFNIWTTNTATAYAFGVAASEFFNKPNKAPFVIGGLVIATIMAVTGIYNVFMSFLIALGVFIPPLGGIIIGDYFYSWKKAFPKIEFVKFRKARYANWIAYIVSTVGAYISSVYEIGIPSLNGIILAIVLVYAVNKIFESLKISDHHEILDDAEYMYKVN